MKGVFFSGRVTGRMVVVFCLTIIWVYAIVGICFAQEKSVPLKKTVSADDKAAVKGEPAKQKPKDIFDFTIPSSWGRVEQIYKGTSPQVIVHIQDAHCNYQCETNISKIVNRLVKEYGLRLAGIEGSSGPIDTGVFASFPEDDIRGQTADYFVRQGKLSGVEALVISKGIEYPLKIYGIEDRKLYDNNFDAFKTAYPFKAEAESYFDQLNQCLVQLKTHIYNKQLTAFDAQQIMFRAGLMDLNDYAQYLANELKKTDKKIKAYPVFANLIKAIDAEHTLDFAAAEEQRTKLLTKLTNVLSEKDIRRLLDKGLAYRNKEMSAYRYLKFVKQLALENKVDFSQYPDLDKYIAYAGRYAGIDSTELFGEMDEINDAVRNGMYTMQAQRDLDFYIRGLQVMRRLVEIKMVNRDLAFYEKNKDLLTTDQYKSFISAQAQKFGIAIKIPQNIDYLDVYMPAWVDFYHVAAKRDEAMVDNSLSLMKEHKQKLMVMIVGGFHTRALTKILKERGISYLVITPRITSNKNNRYFDILEGKKSNLEKFVDSIKLQPTAEK